MNDDTIKNNIIKCGTLTINDFIGTRKIIPDDDLNYLEEARKKIIEDNILKNFSDTIRNDIDSMLIRHYFHPINLDFMSEGLPDIIKPFPGLQLPRFTAHGIKDEYFDNKFSLSITQYEDLAGIIISQPTTNSYLYDLNIKAIMNDSSYKRRYASGDEIITFERKEYKRITAGAHIKDNEKFNYAVNINMLYSKELLTSIKEVTNKSLFFRNKIYLIVDNKANTTLGYKKNNWEAKHVTENVIIIGFDNKEPFLLTYDNIPVDKDINRILYTRRI